MHVSDDDSNKFCKFVEIWWTLKKCWNLTIFLGRHCWNFSVKKFNFSEKAQISHACFWWWFQYVLQVWWNLLNFEKMLRLRHSTCTKSHVLAQMAILAHLCEQRTLWQVCSFAKYRQSLRHSIYYGSNVDFRTIDVNSEGSGKSAHLHSLA